jgi:H+-translocating NAD(P) transhydrogenase subunit beta
VAMYLINISYFITAIIFILGLKRMSSPKTARSGIVWAGWAMLLGVLVTFGLPQLHGVTNYLLMVTAIAIGTVIALYSGRKIAMADMPQMIALYNGMGGGAAGAIAAIEWLEHGSSLSFPVMSLTLAGAVIGTISFSGSLIAFAKLQGILQRTFVFRQQQWLNLGLMLLLVVLLVSCGVWRDSVLMLSGLFAVLLIMGISLTLPVGGANMPVVISLFNAMTGLAVGLEGFALNNPAMMIAGTVVGAAGALLTQLMAKAMNQSLIKILFTAHNPAAQITGSIDGTLKAIEPADAAVSLAYASKVIIVPGYGMAVAQAQHKLWELVQQLEKRQVKVMFAIHPVAGRMPGHMNVLLAEAGVPYELIADLEDINPEFATADVALVIGANDVVNPIARTEPESPIYGMPILDVDCAKQVFIVKRGEGKGFSGIENALFYKDHARMLYGDGQAMMSQLVQAIKEI